MDRLVAEAAAVAVSALAKLGPIENWPAPDGYPDSLALAVIDSVYSLAALYSGVVNVIGRYRNTRAAEGGNADEDSLSDLVAAIKAHGVGELFVNAQVAPGTKTRKKYDVIAEVAQRLIDAGINTQDDFRAAYSDSDRRANVKGAWLGTSGLGPASWNYLVLLSGEQDVKGDRMVQRFVEEVTDDSTVDPEKARQIVLHAAKILGVDARLLDHAIWAYQRTR